MHIINSKPSDSSLRLFPDTDPRSGTSVTFPSSRSTLSALTSRLRDSCVPKKRSTISIASSLALVPYQRRTPTWRRAITQLVRCGTEVGEKGLNVGLAYQAECCTSPADLIYSFIMVVRRPVSLSLGLFTLWPRFSSRMT